MLYFTLKEKYLAGNSTTDCLAVAREFYCAYSYPYCLDDVNDPHRGVCQNLCSIWASRCPNEEYNLFCENAPTTDCSKAQYFIISILLALMLLS